MRAVHDSWPVGQKAEGVITLNCPYSLALRWRWRDRFHSLDVVLYGDLTMTSNHE